MFSFLIFCAEKWFFLAGIYLLKINNRNTGTRCEICSKLTIKTPEQRQYRSSSIFFVNFEHISHLIVHFEHAIAGWGCSFELLNQFPVSASNFHENNVSNATF